MKTQSKKTLIAKALYLTGIKAVLALFLTLSALASCMQAEKISLDTSGAQGLLLGSLSLEGGLFGGGSGGATGPFSKDGNPTVVATSPTNAATIAPCSGSPCRARVRIQFDESMDTSTVLPLLVEISDGSWADSSIAPLTSSISWSGTKYQNDTVAFELDSVHLPEGSNFKFNILTGYLKDLDSVPNDLSAPYSWTATTSFQSGRLPLVDTGSTLCTDASSTIWDVNACSLGQDPLVSQPRNLVNNGNGTVSDTVTGLLWSSCTEGKNYSVGTCSGSEIPVSWNAAVAACSDRNTSLLGGRSDWRLPTYDELLTIVDLDQYSPSLDTSLFPGAMTAIYWSASVPLENAASAYYVHFDNGAFIRIAAKSESHYVRCVAGSGNRSTAGFVDQGNDTVSDQRTGLRWTRCPIGPGGTACEASNAAVDWNYALSICSNLALAGKSWRLPSRNEMLSIWTPQTVNHLPTGIDLNGGSNVWTSTTSRQEFLSGSNGRYPNAFIAVFGSAPSISPVSGKGATSGFFCVADE